MDINLDDVAAPHSAIPNPTLADWVSDPAGYLRVTPFVLARLVELGRVKLTRPEQGTPYYAREDLDLFLGTLEDGINRFAAQSSPGLLPRLATSCEPLGDVPGAPGLDISADRCSPPIIGLESRSWLSSRM